MPMGSSGSDGGAMANEKRRQARIDSGMTGIQNAFSGFNDKFFEKRAQDYRDYATPQVMREYGDTKNSLAYALSRNGLNNSSAAVTGNKKLGETLTQNLSNVANQGQNEANQLRTNVAAQRSDVTNQLISSADPSVARGAALSATAGLQAPSSFAPIGDMFGDFANNYISNISARAYNGAQDNSVLGFLSNIGSRPQQQPRGANIIQ